MKHKHSWHMTSNKPYGFVQNRECRVCPAKTKKRSHPEPIVAKSFDYNHMNLKGQVDA